MDQLVIVVVLLALGLYLERLRSNAHQQRIRNYLHSKGASDIVTAVRWVGRDGTNMSARHYNVEYVDRYRVSHKTHCKLSDLNDEMLWPEPPEV
ncbi:hypothetical protein ANRL3_02521 [Anaerolineae bacterium]|nr:hypothetical protein ANRL3_02521 [Anaerolineae bacterium]